MVAGWGLRVRVPEPPSGSEEAGGGHPSQNRRARPSRCCSINALTRSAWVTGPMWPTPSSSTAITRGSVFTSSRETEREDSGERPPIRQRAGMSSPRERGPRGGLLEHRVPLVLETAHRGGDRGPPPLGHRGPRAGARPIIHEAG